MLRALRGVVLALINATLILVIIALFLGLRLAGTVERVAEGAAASAVEVAGRLEPVRESVTGLQEEMARLRAELSGLQRDTEDRASEVAASLENQLTQMEARLDALNARLEPAIEAVGDDPGILIDRAVAAGVAEVGDLLISLRGCVPTGV